MAKKNTNMFYTLVEYFVKKIIFLHSYSRPFSDFSGHGNCIVVYWKLKRKKICLGWGQNLCQGHLDLWGSDRFMADLLSSRCPRCF